MPSAQFFVRNAGNDAWQDRHLFYVRVPEEEIVSASSHSELSGPNTLRMATRRHIQRNQVILVMQDSPWLANREYIVLDSVKKVMPTGIVWELSCENYGQWEAKSRAVENIDYAGISYFPSTTDYTRTIAQLISDAHLTASSSTEKYVYWAITSSDTLDATRKGSLNLLYKQRYDALSDLIKTFDLEVDYTVGFLTSAEMNLSNSRFIYIMDRGKYLEGGTIRDGAMPTLYVGFNANEVSYGEINQNYTGNALLKAGADMPTSGETSYKFKYKPSNGRYARFARSNMHYYGTGADSAQQTTSWVIDSNAISPYMVDAIRWQQFIGWQWDTTYAVRPALTAIDDIDYPCLGKKYALDYGVYTYGTTGKLATGSSSYPPTLKIPNQETSRVIAIDRNELNLLDVTIQLETASRFRAIGR